MPQSGSNSPSIVCFGPGPSAKGGIAQYNTSLSRAFVEAGANVKQVAWTRQYPFFIPRDFKDRSSRSNLTEGFDIPVEYLTDYNNPLTWGRTVDRIVAMKPDIVLIHWYNPTQGIPLAVIAKKLRKAGIPRIIFDLHLVKTKEKSHLDGWLTRRTFQHATDIVLHGMSVRHELKELMGTSFMNQVRIIDLFHPIYSVFEASSSLDVEALKTELQLRKHVFLFFGFIRKYKGLHNCIEAFDLLSRKRDDVSLLICGESFWDTVDKRRISVKIKSAIFRFFKAIFLSGSDNEKEYRPLALIDGLPDRSAVVVKNEFIPNEDVHKYFQVSDAVLLFYENATPSGVESLAYNFGIPVLATDVGNFSSSIVEGKNGYIAPAGDIRAMADQMERIINNPIDAESVREQTEAMSWSVYVSKILFKG